METTLSTILYIVSGVIVLGIVRTIAAEKMIGFVPMDTSSVKAHNRRMAKGYIAWAGLALILSIIAFFIR